MEKIALQTKLETFPSDTFQVPPQDRRRFTEKYKNSLKLLPRCCTSSAIYSKTPT